MAKSIHIIIALLCISVGASATINEQQACLDQVYSSQIGVRELTGNNDGKQVEAYLRAVDIYQPVAWCAAFVKWVFVACAIETTGNAWSPSWFPVSKQVKEPQKGDVFGLYFKRLKRIGHVGFVDEVHEDYVLTVEGNTNKAGSREGDGVYRKRRLRTQLFKVSRWLE